MIEIKRFENTLAFKGELKTPDIKSAWRLVKKEILAVPKGRILFDFSELNSIDSAGVAFLDEIKSAASKKIEFINVGQQINQAIQTFSTAGTPEPKPPRSPSFFEKMGDVAVRAYQGGYLLLLLAADIFYWGVAGIFQKKGQREGSFVRQSLLIGVNALLIVGLISFLIGLILALQSAAQLRQFGANIFVADLIGISMLREMGPIMTAIVVAGRSGSAIAAEIATMVVTEEMDALKTMALNPIRFVVVPKFHAITITLPLLTIFSDLIGIIGGFLIGVTYLQLSAAAFFNELLTVLILKDVFTGLIKSVVFAWIILIVSCYQGLRVTGGAEGVGKATTASVVASIFFVIVADSILGLIFYFGQPLA